MDQGVVFLVGTLFTVMLITLCSMKWSLNKTLKEYKDLEDQRRNLIEGWYFDVCFCKNYGPFRASLTFLYSLLEAYYVGTIYKDHKKVTQFVGPTVISVHEQIEAFWAIFNETKLKDLEA